MEDEQKKPRTKFPKEEAKPEVRPTYLSDEEESFLGQQIHNHESQPNNALDYEYESKIRPYMDLIDSLRALGVEKDLALPSIAVIGDQSSGKSSVLEALSGVCLPRGSGIITRCPLELRLRKQSSGSKWMGTLSYQGQTVHLQNPSQVEHEVRKAQSIISESENGISGELISLKVMSRNVPNLTLIDLPGMTRVSLPDQPEDIGEQIKRIIKKYITQDETIILVVVPSNTDIATTEALALAREVDPNGLRTIGILTKPDLVDKGTEANVSRVVENRVYPLKKGYMIVKCRGQAEIDNKISCEDAQRIEKDFFEKNIYFSHLLEEGRATIPLLAERLSTELVEHIRKNLSNVEAQVNDKFEKAETKLRTLCPEKVENDAEKLQFLLSIIKKFTDTIEDVTKGDEDGKKGCIKLFTHVRRHFNDWESDMTGSTDEMITDLTKNPIDYENEYRGREFREFTSYKALETISREHIQNLEVMAINRLNDINGIVRTCFNDLASKHFSQYINLCVYAKAIIDDICKEQRTNCEDSIRTQFQMEELIYCHDAFHEKALEEVRGQKTEGQIPSSSAELLLQHIKAYFMSATNRLTNQIPLMIRYYILHQFADKLHTNMMLLWQENKSDEMLEEEGGIKRARNALKEQIYRLDEAKQKLLKLPSQPIEY